MASGVDAVVTMRGSAGVSKAEKLVDQVVGGEEEDEEEKLGVADSCEVEDEVGKEEEQRLALALLLALPLMGKPCSRASSNLCGVAR